MWKERNMNKERGRFSEGPLEADSRRGGSSQCDRHVFPKMVPSGRGRKGS